MATPYTLSQETIGALKNKGLLADAKNAGTYINQNLSSGYYKEGDLQNLLNSGYYAGINAKGEANYNYLANPTTGKVLRVRPGSGTTAASRAESAATGDTTLGYKDTSNGLIASQGQNVKVGETLNPDGSITPAPANLAQQAADNQIIDQEATAGAQSIRTGQSPSSSYFAKQAAAQGVNPVTGQPISKYEAGFNAAKGAGARVPGSQSGESDVVGSYVSPDNQAGFSFVQNDPYMANLVKSFQDYMDPKNQRASLTETYQKLLKSSGIEKIDTDLINMKNVIEGSEDDIRTEITKAGGFATESQVLALTNARNKQLIKNYNTLLETRNAKEQYLQTAINLESQDRQAADQRFNTIFNMESQIANYGMQMQKNAVDRLDKLQATIGLDGIYNSVKGDPNSVRLIERTMGFPPGTLAQGAAQAALARTQQSEKDKLALDIQRAQLAKAQAELGTVNTGITDIGGRKYLINTKTGNIIKEITPSAVAGNEQQLAQQKAGIDLTNGLVTSNYLSGAVGPNGLSRLSPFSYFTGGKQNFIAGVEQLRSGLNLQSLIDAKAKGATFGALSDQELQVLANTATKIGTWAIKDDKGQVTGYNVGEADFKRELDKINNFAKMDYILKGGNPAEVGVTTMPDGTHWVKNSDGTLTQL